MSRHRPYSCVFLAQREEQAALAYNASTHWSLWRSEAVRSLSLCVTASEPWKLSNKIKSQFCGLFHAPGRAQTVTRTSTQRWCWPARCDFAPTGDAAVAGGRR